MPENMLYKDASKPIDERVEDLLSRMTLDEKIAQLNSIFGIAISDSDDGVIYENLEVLGKDGIGEIVAVQGRDEQLQRNINEVQRFFIEDTRLGIPVIFHTETLTGVPKEGMTVFPQSIGIAATWEPELVEKMTSAIREEMMVVGYRQALAPVLDITIDPRWGRVSETYGEDPYLVSALGIPYVKGLQTDNLLDGVISTGKHYLGYGFSEAGKNLSESHIGQRELYEVYARPFAAAIQDSNLQSVMNSYGIIDGVPVAASKEILTDLLRDILEFQGIVVSDYNSLLRLAENNQVADNLQEAAILGINAGIDIELPETIVYGKPLKEVVEKGLVSEELIDTSVRRVLESKFKLGLFENPYAEGDVDRVLSNPQHKQLSREIAEKSMTLLKNENDLLPLSDDLKTIAVIGPNADSLRNLFGDYTLPGAADFIFDPFIQESSSGDTKYSNPLTVERRREVYQEAIEEFNKLGRDEEVFTRNLYDGISILQAIQELVGDSTEIVYAKGSTLKDDSTEGFDEAVRVAENADVAIVILGGKMGHAASNTSGEGIDAAYLDLPGVQQELLEAVHATGTPVVLVLVNGRPLSIQWADENIPAILEAWGPGNEGARAVADVLFGKVNPGGKLPITFPQTVGQVPIYYYHKPYSPEQYGNDYIDETSEPLYPFGHGLSYTQFEYSNLDIDKKQVPITDSVNISMQVKNTGDRKGEEVVQLYIRDQALGVSRPFQQLIGFKRVPLEPDQSSNITFTVPMNLLSFIDMNGDLVVEPGIVEVMIGSSSEDIRLNGEFEIVGEKKYINPDERVYTSQVEVSYFNETKKIRRRSYRANFYRRR